MPGLVTISNNFWSKHMILLSNLIEPPSINSLAGIRGIIVFYIHFVKTLIILMLVGLWLDVVLCLTLCFNCCTFFYTEVIFNSVLIVFSLKNCSFIKIIIIVIIIILNSNQEHACLITLHQTQTTKP